MRLPEHILKLPEEDQEKYIITLPREYRERLRKNSGLTSAKVKPQRRTYRKPSLHYDIISKNPDIKEIEKDSPEYKIYGLPWLAREIQYEIVKASVTTNLPFINHGFGTRTIDPTSGAVRNERRGQDDVNGNIMLCCKAYYKEGIKAFWKDNTFLYSGCWMSLGPFSTTPRWQFTGYGYEQTWTLYSYPPVRYARGFKTLRHMDLRLDTTNYPQHRMIGVMDAVRFAYEYPNVKTLCLQLVPRGKVEPFRGSLAWLNELRSLFHEVINGDSYWMSHNQKYSADLDGSNGGQLTEFHLRGIPRDNVSLLCIVCASLLVKAEGKLGLDFWDEEKLSAVKDDGKYSYIRGYDNDIDYWTQKKDWIQKKDLRNWVWEECQNYIDDDKVFDWRAFFGVPDHGIIVAED